jgi:RNA polymerase sigma factor (sigma-70 family)
MDEAPVLSSQPERFILALHEALEELARVGPRQARVVELRYFGGLTDEETAYVLKTSPRTVRRDWLFAKAWLSRELGRL